MATKNPKTVKAAPPLSKPVTRNKLTRTDVPGLYRNRTGQIVDEHGVVLDFKNIKSKDDDRAIEVIGKRAETPADVLKIAAMDPRLPMHVRLDAANKAAPYFSAKRVAVQGGGEGAPPINLQAAVEAMPSKELNAFVKALEAAGEKLDKALGKMAP